MGEGTKNNSFTAQKGPGNKQDNKLFNAHLSPITARSTNPTPTVTLPLRSCHVSSLDCTKLIEKTKTHGKPKSDGSLE